MLRFSNIIIIELAQRYINLIVFVKAMSPSRVEEDTAEERRNKETEKRYIYNKVWTNRENTHRNKDITHNIHR